MIEQTQNYAKEHFMCEIVYGDTDSCYVIFPESVDDDGTLTTLFKKAEHAAAEISKTFGELLIQLSRANLALIQHELAPLPESESEYEINLEIESKKIEGDLEKVQMTKSRRGQGIFKANVRLIEKSCRVTGVSNIKHLRASHIKPWAVSNNEEKLDGYNGLLLSPHVDHLFDRGFISFNDKGSLLISSELNPIVLDQWSIHSEKNVGPFKEMQSQYLEYHREVVFQH